MSNFQVYIGREGRTERGLAHSVVMELVKPYYGSHLCIFMDNFYSGVPLFEDLKAHGVNACGTIRLNRKRIPPKPQAMRDIQEETRGGPDRRHSARVPHMKGVDLLDQLVGYYQFQHGSKEWWRRLFFFFLSVSCYNSYILAMGAEAYKGSYKEWVEDLAQELVTPVTSRSAPQCTAGPVSASAEHDCQKIFDKRQVCWECSLAKSSTRGPCWC
ncbi:hypothetical protein ACEWY4_018303 [Coilia grayii]|uniref:PiggyBac transposable element-derived protein domain-containing protein n=1 Tax=Coilia grayii TaxID=363190 RepID=A0ABD1JJB1_9TELE